ncbi:hypothetical protein [Asanoa sp. NPDC050611]|uniref:DUF6993 domain-containing protein n=1 Tax=Asanoa sp. NPDC050611 TaxID=3157098 RepID=UPI0033D6B06C
MRNRRVAWWVGSVLGLLALGCAGPGAGAPDPVTIASPQPSVSGLGDVPPHHADNNAWKQRHELSAAEQRAGEDLAARIRPKLAALRAAGDFAPSSTERVLVSLGIEPADLEVTPMRPPVGTDTSPTGVVYAVRFGTVGCVIGDVRPSRLLVQVTAAAAEFGCLEPFTH